MGNDEHYFALRSFVSDNDADAIVWAKQLADGHDTELWSGERFVLKLEAKKENPASRRKSPAMAGPSPPTGQCPPHGNEP